MLLACADGWQDRTQQPAPSVRKQAAFLHAIHTLAALRKMRCLLQKRAVIMGGLSSKKDWLLISSKKGNGLKMKEGNRAKINPWVRAHPDVVCSSLRCGTILAPVPTADDPTRTLEKDKLVLLESRVRELCSHLTKPGAGLPGDCCKGWEETNQ